MAIIWCINHDVLHTTNNGFDSEKNPIIPFLEFLHDAVHAGDKDFFH